MMMNVMIEIPNNSGIEIKIRRVMYCVIAAVPQADACLACHRGAAWPAQSCYVAHTRSATFGSVVPTAFGS